MLFSAKWWFFFYLFSIILLTTLPLNSARELNHITVIHLRGDYFFHSIMFLPWMFFRRGVSYSLVSWFFFGLLSAAATESLQYFLPYRAFNVNDLLANGLGVLVSLGLASLVSYLKRNLLSI